LLIADLLITMITVEAIYTAPVKSLGLQSPESVIVGPRGISGDRHFYLVDERGRLLTQRELGKLVQVQARYGSDAERLNLEFPDGSVAEGGLELGRGIGTRVWGRRVRAHILEGGWNEALSEFCGQPVFLVIPDAPGQAFDEFPISLVSQASVEYLGQLSESSIPLDSRRFRPNFLLEGCLPHQEDSWLGGIIQIGEEARIQLVGPDPRCSIVTQSPDTGEPDVDTLNLIKGYRTDSPGAYFGVYGIVERPGTISVGDVVSVPA
jgi:uncharacterized protein YcbX